METFYSLSGWYRYWFSRPGKSGFSAGSTAEEISDHFKNRVNGKVFIVTGANSGLGKEASRVFYKNGAHVIVACRSEQKGLDTIEQFKKQHPTSEGKLTYIQLDLQDFNSIDSFADEFLKLNVPLHVLLNNAGIMAYDKYTTTKHGIEAQFGTNHLGHYYLTSLMYPKLAETEDSRIVNLTSSAHYVSYPPGILDQKDINNPELYEPWKAYGQAKLAPLLDTKNLVKRAKEENSNVKAFAVHPGVINTGLQTASSSTNGKFFGYVVNIFGKSLGQGAASQVFASLSTDLENGSFVIDCNAFQPDPKALDEALQKKLETISQNMVKDIKSSKM